LSQAIKDCAKVTHSNTVAISHDTDYLRRESDRTKHSKLVAWISPTNFPAQQSDLIGRKQEGTGQWFLDAPQYAQWLGQPGATLFCSGMPGMYRALFGFWKHRL
jgi:hypothetical protein